MIDLITKGGPLIWLLLGCSLLALGIFLERFFYFHRSAIDVGELLQGLANLVKKKNYAEARHECAGTPGPVARVVKSALMRHELARTDLKDVVQEAGQLEVPKLERYLPVLLSICYVAPLIGLLGTVLGLTDTFIRLKNGNGFATPGELSQGVYESLITSAGGLVVAIPAYLLYAYLAAFVKSLIHDMERGGIEIVNIITDNRPEARDDQIIAFDQEATRGRRNR